MSDDAITEPEVTESATDTPADSGNVDEAYQEPAETYLVTIDGEDSEVSLDELRQGYSRQADYTRKTQALSQEKERLQQAEAITTALDADPQGTIQALMDAYGVDIPTPSDRTEGATDEYVDPLTLRLAQVEARLDAQARQNQQAALDKQLQGLHDRYGDFNHNELFQHALKNKITNLDAAYTHMSYGDVEEKARKADELSDILEKKRSAGVVEGGSSAQTGSVVSQASVKNRPNTLREAFIAAKEALGA